jgi:predicted amidohydrolase
MLRIGYFQFSPVFGKISYNLQKVIQKLNNVSADIIVLPELAFSGYYFKDRDELISLAESIDRSLTLDALKALCRQQDFFLVTGFAEKYLDKYFNSALLIGPDGRVQVYRKLHLFNQEKSWFDPGDTPLVIYDILDVKVGMMICFDWIFPEVIRVLALKGADIICHPSNLVLQLCQSAMITRCIENNVYAITANRYGKEKRAHGEIYFTGKSQITGPKGKLIHRAHAQREELYVAEVDVRQARDKNITPHNQLFNERRPEYYSILCKM